MNKYILSNEKRFLKGKLRGYPIKEFKNKFNLQGKPVYYPGCTIISKINHNSTLFEDISLIQKKLKKITPPNAYTFLPPSSFHLTIFDCCNIDTFNTPYWPKNIPITNNYKKVATKLKKKLKYFIFPKKLNFKLNKLFGGYCLVLDGFNKEQEILLRNLRNNLSKLLGIKLKNHNNYSFHITLAYMLRSLTKKEINHVNKKSFELANKFKKKINIITLRKPNLCIFENMYEFKSIT